MRRRTIAPIYYAILPILNKSVECNSSIPWVLSDDLIFRAIEEKEQRLIIDNSSLIFPSNEVSGKIFLLSLPDVNNNLDDSNFEHSRKQLEESVRLDALSLQAVFNFIGLEETMTIPYGIIVEKTRLLKLVHVFDFEQDFLSSKLKPYSILPTVTNTEVQQLIILARRIIRSDKQLQTTFRRFCSAFVKTSWEDRLIDLTIALESLIEARTEVSFKFAYLLSLIISSAKDQRSEAYKKLNDLYDARSAIVHGTTGESAKKIASCKKNWQELVNFAKQCILYRLEFKDKHPNESWMNHLISLGFGNS